MDWFKGTIIEAITASRQRKCLFVVVVTGEDDGSKQLLERLDDVQISQLFKNFVSISLKVGSTEANQFSQLYPVLVVPAIFLIGLQGTPIEVIGGSVESSEIVGRTTKALELHNKELNPQSQETPAPSTSSATAPEEVKPAEEATEQPEDSLLPLEVRVARANQRLEALRVKKAAEEREKEKAQEKERREIGKQLQQAKEAQKERELREQVEERQKEKREEREARERVLAQLAQDRAERSARYQAARVTEEERKREAQLAQEKLQQERASAKANARSAFARIQFRLPDGSSRNEQFSSDSKLSDVKAFVDSEIKPSFRPYSLCTTFPRREFTASNFSETLRDLELSPSAVLLIVPTSTKQQAPGSQGGWFTNLLAPFFWIWNLIASFLFASAPAIDRPPAEPQPPTNQGGVRRRRPEGNIRRVVDSSAGDSSDDNATWNGNSTQQL